jgi:hypothetical protein
VGLSSTGARRERLAAGFFMFGRRRAPGLLRLRLRMTAWINRPVIASVGEVIQKCNVSG